VAESAVAASDPGTGRSRPRGAAWILVAAAVLYAMLLLVGPLAGLLWGAFREGVSPFLREVLSADALHALKLTLLLSLAATAVNTILGTCVAYVLVRDDFPGKRWLNGLVDLPFAVSPVIAGFMLVLLFGRGGWLASAAHALGIKVVFALPGMLLATVFVSLPFVTRELMPVLEQTGTQSEAAAYTIGASPWKTFWLITVPAIRWGLLYGISLTFARAMGEFGAVLVVSGNVSGLTETAPLFIYRALDERNTVGAFAMAVVLAVFSFLLLLAMEFLRKKRRRRV
jgi:sulfate transport system permease protein